MTNFGHRIHQDEDFKEVYKKELAHYKHLVVTDDEFSERYGDLGRVYGAQWRSWQGPNQTTVDQIKEVIHQIKTNPNSRRLLVNAWNPAEVDNMALPPCHCLFQFYVADGKLSCQLYQRSADIFLGVPFNIASYALLTHLIAHECDLEVGEFIHTLGDAHIYANHMDQITLQLSRGPKAPFPTLSINDEKKSIFDFDVEDISITNYVHHPAIKAPVAV